MNLTEFDREVADYVTVGLVIGLPWEEARRIARQIVAEKRGA